MVWPRRDFEHAADVCGIFWQISPRPSACIAVEVFMVGKWEWLILRYIGKCPLLLSGGCGNRIDCIGLQGDRERFLAGRRNVWLPRKGFVASRPPNAKWTGRQSGPDFEHQLLGCGCAGRLSND